MFVRVRTWIPVACCSAMLVAGLVGCAEQKKCNDGCGKDGMCCKDAPAKPLYERLGGEKAVATVVHDFVHRAAGDPKVNFTRKGTSMEWDATPANVAHLEKLLTQFICMATGGPQKYEGRDMKTTHRGMMISNAEFDALAGHLAAALDAAKVPMKEKDEVMKIAGSTRKDIVEK